MVTMSFNVLLFANTNSFRRYFCNKSWLQCGYSGYNVVKSMLLASPYARIRNGFWKKCCLEKKTIGGIQRYEKKKVKI